MILQQNEKVYGINYIPEPLTKEEEKEFIKLMKKGDSNARRILINRNLRLVQFIANKFSNTGIEIEELASIGTIGLIKGIDTFKPVLNIKFSTYACRCIENEILQFLRKNKKYMNDISLEVPIKTDEDLEHISLKDAIKVTDTELELYENRMYASEVLYYILNELKNIQKICILYFAGGYRQEEIAKKICVSQSYVSRMICSARKNLETIIKMRKKLYKRKYTVEVYNRSYYKVSLEIGETHKYNKISEVISSSIYQAIYRNNQHIELFINSEREAMELLAEIIQIVE